MIRTALLALAILLTAEQATAQTNIDIDIYAVWNISGLRILDTNNARSLTVAMEFYPLTGHIGAHGSIDARNANGQQITYPVTGTAVPITQPNGNEIYGMAFHSVSGDFLISIDRDTLDGTITFTNLAAASINPAAGSDGGTITFHRAFFP